MGTVRRALIETAADGYLEARLPENSIVRVQGGPELVGRHAQVRITSAKSWILTGDIQEMLD